MTDNLATADTTRHTPSRLWLIDDDAALRLILADTFMDAGLEVIRFTQAQAAWIRLNDILAGQASKETLPDVILTDIRMPLMDGLSFSDWVHEHFPELPVIIMTAHSDLSSAINSYQTGAFDYLPKPFDLDDAVALVDKAIAQGMRTQPSTNLLTNEAPDTASTAIDDNQKEQTPKTPPKPVSTPKPSKPVDDAAADTANDTDDETQSPTGIIGQSQAMQTVFRAIGRLAYSPITVLITGESGTGKELVASALHEHSPRHDAPFIALNMAAIPHDLIESELFGHEKGAFTGATTQRQGRFEQANGGTLFLDEIGDMPFSTQTRLLRVLANGEFYRVGGRLPVKVDVRIIAATHQNLEQLVKKGTFREDLFYRLNVIRLPLPPLRARPEDIPALSHYFLQQAGKQMNTKVKALHHDALAIMQAFDWRGNVRQLENVCLWLTVMATGDTILAEDLPPELQAAVNTQATSHDEPATIASDIHQRPEPFIPANSAPVSPQSISSTLPHNATNWQQPLRAWATAALAAGQTDILQAATPEFEHVLLTAALEHSDGKKIAAAKLLGWGRNTLTRKLQQFEADDMPQSED